MRKIYHYIILIIGFLQLQSCSDWLEIDPKTTIVSEKLFRHEKGFKQALNGVYYLLTEKAIYGTELTVGLPDVLGQYWNIQKNHSYEDLATFDYTSANSERVLLGVWQRMYEAIANVNMLLEQLEQKDSTAFKSYTLLMGEALGLRAYLHLDLFQLFGPVLSQSSEIQSIPYRTKYSNETVPLLAANELLDCIEQDLLRAKRLLKSADPYAGVIDQETITDMSITNRSLRMNYYAVLSTLARLALLRGEGYREEAIRYAKEVIASEHFALVEPNVQLSLDVANRDLLFSKELVFCLHDEKRDQKLNKMVDVTSNPSTGGMFYLDYDYIERIYEKDYRDLRYIEWIGTTTLYTYVKKYRKNGADDSENSETTNKWPYIPMIRLTEMYYLLTECYIGKEDIKALEYLNRVREARNLTPLKDISGEELANELMKERQKEYLGEGKLFFTYKRLFQNLKGVQGEITATNELFCLPIPKTEFEFANH